MELAVNDEVGSRKTDEMGGMLGKGIRSEEGRNCLKQKGKPFHETLHP